MFTFGSLPAREIFVAALIGSLLIGALLASFSTGIIFVLRRRWFAEDAGWKKAAWKAWFAAVAAGLLSTFLIVWDFPGFERTTSLLVAGMLPIAAQILVLARAPWKG